MVYLSEEINIFHRDLKGQNIFLDRIDNRLQAKVGDFDVAISKDDRSWFSRILDVGTYGFKVFNTFY